MPTGPKDPKSTVLSIEDEAIIVASQAHAASADPESLHSDISPIPRSFRLTGRPHRVRCRPCDP
ncbi:hypothetical protein RHIZ404_200700 [Rhizobium sp. EC-SD404]|nr:hypothetical protein RHIZ404_200700 [Rhizobium sp. EC-SD404]